MAVSFYGEWAPKGNTNGSVTVTGAPSPSGGLIVVPVAIRTRDETLELSVSDDGGNTYSLIPMDGGYSDYGWVFYTVGSSPASSITVTSNAPGVSMNISAFIYTGVDASSPIEDVSYKVHPNTTTYPPVEVTPGAGSLVFGTFVSGVTDRVFQQLNYDYEDVLVHRSGQLTTQVATMISVDSGQSTGPGWEIAPGSGSAAGAVSITIAFRAGEAGGPGDPGDPGDPDGPGDAGLPMAGASGWTSSVGGARLAVITDDNDSSYISTMPNPVSEELNLVLPPIEAPTDGLELALRLSASSGEATIIADIYHMESSSWVATSPIEINSDRPEYYSVVWPVASLGSFTTSDWRSGLRVRLRATAGSAPLFHQVTEDGLKPIYLGIVSEDGVDVGSMSGGAVVSLHRATVLAVAYEEGGEDPEDPTPPEPGEGPSPGYWAQWENGPSTDDTWFPIGAYLPDLPSDHSGIVAPYSDLGAGLADAGFNLAVGTWSWMGGTYMNRARELGIKVLATGGLDEGWEFLQNNPQYGDLIIGWQAGDEYDMKRPNDGAPFGPNSPTTIYNMYQQYVAKDPTRPVHINWGKPMAGNHYVPSGGTDTGSNTGDLALYQQACDVSSADYYWWTDPYKKTPCAFGYGEGVDAQRRYAMISDPNKPLWMFVETSRPWKFQADGVDQAIDPFQLEAAVWSSIVHGARGILYFNHDFGAGTGSSTGKIGIWSASYYDRAGGDAVIAKLKEVNNRLHSLAPVLNSPQLGTVDPNTGREHADQFVTVESSNSEVPIDVMVRKHGGMTYVFAQASGTLSNLGSGNTTGTFTWHQNRSNSVSVRDESRSVNMTNGVWSDSFTPYQMHIYVFPSDAGSGPGPDPDPDPDPPEPGTITHGSELPATSDLAEQVIGAQGALTEWTGSTSLTGTQVIENASFTEKNIRIMDGANITLRNCLIIGPPASGTYAVRINEGTSQLLMENCTVVSRSVANGGTGQNAVSGWGNTSLCLRRCVIRGGIDGVHYHGNGPEVWPTGDPLVPMATFLMEECWLGDNERYADSHSDLFQMAGSRPNLITNYVFRRNRFMAYSLERGVDSLNNRANPATSGYASAGFQNSTGGKGYGPGASYVAVRDNFWEGGNYMFDGNDVWDGTCSITGNLFAPRANFGAATGIGNWHSSNNRWSASGTLGNGTQVTGGELIPGSSE